MMFSFIGDPLIVEYQSFYDIWSQYLFFFNVSHREAEVSVMGHSISWVCCVREMRISLKKLLSA